VRTLIEEAHRENLRLLGEHREELDELASRLLDRVEIAGDEVREVVGRRRKGEAAAAADPGETMASSPKAHAVQGDRDDACDREALLDEVIKYRKFVHERLVPDLNASIERRDALKAELEEYTDLEQSLTASTSEQQGATELVHLGADVYAEGRVHDPHIVYLSIGLGFYVQCTPNEGLEIARVKMGALREAKARAEESATSIRRRIGFFKHMIDEVKGIWSRDPSLEETSLAQLQRQVEELDRLTASGDAQELEAFLERHGVAVP